ncbi:MAG: nucleotidyltransferase family protein, partial [Ginsengibacter sp.]
TKRKTSRYFLFDEFNHLCGWKNTNTGEQKISRTSKTITEKAFSGIHIIDPKIFSLIKMKGKFSMVDAYLDLAKNQLIDSLDHSGSKLMDVGKPENLLEAEKLFP